MRIKMKNKSLFLAILLVFVVILGSSTVFAEDTSDIQAANEDASLVQESDDVAILNDANNDVQTSSEHTISSGSSSQQIQDEINSMEDGEVLNFEPGNYSDICIYVNKSITINGNGANLIGYDNPSLANVPSIIKNTTEQGGYAISNVATLYIVKANNVNITGLTITAGANSSTTTTGARYSNALVYVYQAISLNFENNVIDGSTWGLWLNICVNCTVVNNNVRNQGVSGIFNFGSDKTLIKNNKVTNAVNHGIDVRHGSGSNVQVINNTVIGSKEGIYLMHSKGHTVTQNKIINCSISSISCYGTTNINIYGNTLQKSRIGILLGGGYKNITVGANDFKLDNLPFPPTFVYYIAEGKSDFSSATDMMGTHSDNSLYYPAYTEYKGIKTPAQINVDYDTILSETGTTYLVPEGANNNQIQTMIDSMNDGDTLKFAENAIYENISIYTDKNIKIIGNNATLIGYNNINMMNAPEKVRNMTADGGYAVTYRAVLYVLNNTDVVVSDLNIKSQYPGYDTTKATTTTNEYKTACIYADTSLKLVITDCNLDGASWGIFMQYSTGAIITNNNIQNQYTTGILNFGTGNSIIANNTVTNAINHGIDVRHKLGPKVTVFNNTVIGAKEGIYIMHSQGHNIYNNTIINSKISGITCYGSGNENVFNNSISGSRIGILLGGEYYNVTIGPNTYKLDALSSFPPTPGTYLAKAENKYYQNAEGVYSDKNEVTITAKDVKTTLNDVTFELTITDPSNRAVLGEVNVTINSETYNIKTDENGKASVNVTLATGNYPVTINFIGTDNYAPATAEANILVADQKETTSIIAENVTTTYKKGAFDITLLDESNNPIEGQKIAVRIGSENYTATTDKNGKATIALNLTTGDYDVLVDYAGTDYYEASNKTAKITVLEDRMGSSIAITMINSLEITAVLKDSQGNAIAGETVFYTINGEKANTTTNGNGEFTFEAKDNSVIGLIFEGNDIAVASNATITLKNLKPTPKTTKIDVPSTMTKTAVDFNAGEKGSMFYFYLLDENGKGIANKAVKIGIFDKIYTVKTDKNGRGGLQINIANANYYTYAISFLGDDDYKASFAVCSLQIVKKSVTITPAKTSYSFKTSAKTKTVTATLKSTNSYIPKGKQVTLTVAGKTFKATVGDKGQISFNIGSVTAKGTYKVAIKFAGTNTYAAATSKTITIKIA